MTAASPAYQVRETPLEIIATVAGLDLKGVPEVWLDIIVFGDDQGVVSPRAMIENVIGVLFNWGQLTDAEIVGLLTHTNLGIGLMVGALPEQGEFVRETLRQMHLDSGRTWRLLARQKWTENAQIFIREYAPLLRSFNGDFLDYKDGAYHEVESDALAAQARVFLNCAMVKRKLKDEKQFKMLPFNPSRSDIAELLNAVRHERLIGRDTLSPPCWLDDQHGDLPASECISLRNGILHAPTGKFVGPTPSYFTRNALSFDFDPKAECPLWLSTLNQYWPPKPDGSPADEVALLQEIMGYLLLPWTSLQKIFFFIGSGRNGKGTIARVIRMLLGEPNVAAPSMHSLGTEFGLAPLIGKLAAIVSELAFGRNDDRVTITGYLKTISGEDKVELNRKNSSFWVGVLLTRFLMLANKIPNFADDSTALGARIVALRFNVSFEGKEDPNLTDKLASELPGIFNWSLVGYHRLKKSLRFTEPASGREARDTFKRLASPTRTFVEERCVLEADAFITEDALYAAYKTWCANGGANFDRKTDFIEAVLAGNPGKVAKHRDKTASRPRGFKGIRLLRDGEQPMDSADQTEMSLSPKGGSDAVIPF